MATSRSITWSAKSGATNYQLQISTSRTFASTVVDTTQSTTTYNASGLSNSTPYFWRVKYYSGGVWSGWWFTGSFVTEGAIALPTGYAFVSPIDNATGVSLTPTITWEQPGNPFIGYELDIDTSASFNSSSGSPAFSTTGGGETSLSDFGAFEFAASTLYYMRLRYESASGFGSYATIDFTTGASGGGGITLGSPSISTPAEGATVDSIFEIEWSAVTGAEEYRVLIVDSSESTVENVTTTDLSYVTQVPLNPGEAHTVSVRAEADGGTNTGDYATAEVNVRQLSPSFTDSFNPWAVVAERVSIPPGYWASQFTLEWVMGVHAEAYLIDFSSSSFVIFDYSDGAGENYTSTGEFKLHETTTPGNLTGEVEMILSANPLTGPGDAEESLWFELTTVDEITLSNIPDSVANGIEVLMQPPASSVSLVNAYEYELSTRSDFRYLIDSGTSATDTFTAEQAGGGLAEKTRYYLRVRRDMDASANIPAGISNWITTSFTTP